jgi:hypothetical protein
MEKMRMKINKARTLIYNYLLTKVGIGIQKTNAGIGIPASVISVRYRTKKCQTEAFYSGTGPVTTSLVFFSPVPD